MKIRIAGLVEESYVDGEGIRFAIFMQGCLRNCKGCHNPETHDLNGGKIIDTSEIIAKIKKNPLLTGLRPPSNLPKLQKIWGLMFGCIQVIKLKKFPMRRRNF